MSTSIDLSCRLLCACEAAYCIADDAKDGQYNPCDGNPNVTVDMRKQYNAVGFIGNPYIVTCDQIEAAIVGKTDAGIIIGLRGTLKPGFNPDSILDWIQDLLAFPSSDEYLTGKVHTGFLLAVTLLAEGINNAVTAIQNESSENKNLSIYITGHSKGGGMAPIATMYLKNKYGLNSTQTLFFAGPNPGDTDFCSKYNEMFSNTVRYQNYLDIIPLLPPVPLAIDALETTLKSILPEKLVSLLNDAKDWDYSDVGTMMYIDKERNVTKESSLGAGITDTEDWLAITTALLTGHASDVADAHHSACGYGYMDGTCKGDVCGSK